MLDFTFSFKRVTEIQRPEASALMQPILDGLESLEHG